MPLRSRVAVFVFSVCLIAGRFGLDRMGYDLGIAGEPRWWLIAILVGVLVTSPVKVIWTKRLTLFYVSLLVYLSFVLTSSLWTPDADAANLQLEDLPLLILLMASVPFIFGDNPQRCVRFFWEVLYGIGVSFALLGLYMGPTGQGGRLAVMGGGPNVYARIVALGAFAAVYLWTRTGKMRYLLPFPLSCTAVILSGSRGGVISLLAGVGMLLMTTQRPGRILKIVAITLILSSVPVYIYADKFEQIIAKRFFATYEQQNIGARGFIYARAIDVFEKNIVVGAGIDGFRQTGGAGLFYAHNLLLEAASEGGLVGLCLLLFILWQCGSAFRHTATLEGKFMAGSFFALFVSQLASGTYYDARQMWTSAMLAVMLVPTAAYAPLGKAAFSGTRAVSAVGS